MITCPLRTKYLATGLLSLIWVVLIPLTEACKLLLLIMQYLEPISLLQPSWTFTVSALCFFHHFCTPSFKDPAGIMQKYLRKLRSLPVCTTLNSKDNSAIISRHPAAIMLQLICWCSLFQKLTLLLGWHLHHMLWNKYFTPGSLQLLNYLSLDRRCGGIPRPVGTSLLLQSST